jgi:hypothetical protein
VQADQAWYAPTQSVPPPHPTPPPPATAALDASVPDRTLCELLAPDGCAAPLFREAMQRLYLGSADGGGAVDPVVSVGVGAAITRLNASDDSFRAAALSALQGLPPARSSLSFSLSLSLFLSLSRSQPPLYLSTPNPLTPPSSLAYQLSCSFSRSLSQQRLLPILLRLSPASVRSSPPPPPSPFLPPPPPQYLLPPPPHPAVRSYG